MAKLTENMILARTRATELKNVKKLNCWGCDLSDISILQQLVNVEILSLSANNITSFEDFANCHNLQELYIRKNSIKELNEICYLQFLPKLRVLWLSDNPCVSVDKYRLSVLKMLPKLLKLDNLDVSRQEVEEAMKHGVDLQQPYEAEQNSSTQSTPRKELTKSVEMDVEGNSDENIDHSTLNWEETNKIREQFGLRPVPIEKMSPIKTPLNKNKERNNNILTAVLALIPELDSDGLEAVYIAVTNRVKSLQSS